MLVRRAIVAAVAVVLLTPGPVASAPGPAWARPVDGPVVRPFAPPQARYGAGHLGVDFAARPGTPVRAAGPGTVTFVGTVGGSLHVVVGHDGGLRTSYSFLAGARVRRGDKVGRGDIVGTSGGTGDQHNGSVLHLGLRRGDTYIDPATLFRPVDLTEVVHLAPVDDPLFRTLAAERRGVLDGLGGALSAVGGFATGAGRAAVGVVAAFGRPLAALARGLSDEMLPYLEAYLQRFPAFRNLRYVWSAATAAIAWAKERARCDRRAPDANGEGGSGNRVMLVAGIGSESDGRTPALEVPTGLLGYEPDEVSSFSYAATAEYGRTDTYAPIVESAFRLAEQLRELERAEPGREVDLIAHSQGGVVVLAFLKLVYDPADLSYPPLGTVVTLSSPLDGAPLASAVDAAGTRLAGRALLFEAGQAARLPLWPFPDPRAESVADLAEDSELMRRLRDAELPPTIELTTIGASTDFVVPGDVATTEGARHTVVDTPLLSHSEILSDEDALRVMRSALERRSALPCRDFDEFLIAELVPPLISDAERQFDDLLWSLPVP